MVGFDKHKSNMTLRQGGMDNLLNGWIRHSNARSSNFGASPNFGFASQALDLRIQKIQCHLEIVSTIWQ